MCKEDREIKQRLENLVKAGKIESFKINWTSGKFIVRRKRNRTAIDNEGDIEKFEKMEPIEEKCHDSSFMDDGDSYDM